MCRLRNALMPVNMNCRPFLANLAAQCAVLQRLFDQARQL
jgi:hypothetical protein